MIAALVVLGWCALAKVCWDKWKRWPDPDDYDSEYGVVERYR